MMPVYGRVFDPPARIKDPGLRYSLCSGMSLLRWGGSLTRPAGSKIRAYVIRFIVV